MVGSGESTGVEVDRGIVVAGIDKLTGRISSVRMRNLQVKSNLGQLVLLGSRSRDEVVDQLLELLAAQGRNELQRSAQERLGDGERGVWVSGSLGSESVRLLPIFFCVFSREHIFAGHIQKEDAATHPEERATYHCDWISRC